VIIASLINVFSNEFSSWRNLKKRALNTVNLVALRRTYYNITDGVEVMTVSVSFDRVAEVYDRSRALPNDVMAQLIETLTAELKDCKAVLDVGVGTGRFAEPLQNAGFNVVGVDISRKMVGKAKEKGVKNLILADARSVPFRDKTFDVTVAVHILHLVAEWQKVLVEIYRVSRDAMISLHYASRDPVREAYHELLKQQGYERVHRGKSEQDLRDAIEPAKSLYVGSYDTFADETIANLQQRNRSSNWDIPEDVNLRVLKLLKKQFAAKTFRQELYLSVWQVDSLKALAKT
jgi:ubiquinone/menaquinone biosynthesis C-methylase UbiE